jgi:hypothetical protein
VIETLASTRKIVKVLRSFAQRLLGDFAVENFVVVHARRHAVEPVDAEEHGGDDDERCDNGVCRL